MSLVKKGASFLYHYFLAIIIANLSVGILSLFLKILLITVQGPTTFSRLSEIVTYYLTLTFAFYFLFRSYARKHNTLKLKEMMLVACLILVFHTVVVFTAEWPTVWFITTGSTTLAKLLYASGGYLESLRDIPRLYYFIALLLEDFIFIAFSTFGYSVGSHKQKNIQYDRKYPFKDIIK